MNIKEIAKRIRKTNNSYMLSMSPDIAYEFAEAIIESYKAELLNEVGEPVACVVKDDEDEGEQLMYPAAIFKYKMASEDDIISYLYTSDQVAAAILKAEQRVAEACSRTVYVQADQIKKLTAERDTALARLSEERDIWDRMLGDAADKFAHLEREIDDCLYVLDALWDKQCDKIVTQKWAEILIRNKRVTGASSAEDSSEPTSSE